MCDHISCIQSEILKCENELRDLGCMLGSGVVDAEKGGESGKSLVWNEFVDFLRLLEHWVYESGYFLYPSYDFLQWLGTNVSRRRKWVIAGMLYKIEIKFQIDEQSRIKGSITNTIHIKCMKGGKELFLKVQYEGGGISMYARKSSEAEWGHQENISMNVHGLKTIVQQIVDPAGGFTADQLADRMVHSIY
jgi:hypothetical protein